MRVALWAALWLGIVIGANWTLTAGEDVATAPSASDVRKMDGPDEPPSPKP